MAAIRGLIFDFDGTILDTETPAFQAWHELYDEHGCVFPLEAWAAGLGSDGGHFDPYAQLEALSGRAVERAVIRARRRAREQELVAACEVLPGVLSYLDAATQMGLRCGLASSSPREHVEGHLSRFGLVERFDAIVCAGDVARVKPDPALYRLVLERLGIGSAEAVAIEDSPNGVRAARTADIFTVVVPNAITGRLPLDHADLLVRSLADLSLDQLLRHVESLREAQPSTS